MKGARCAPKDLTLKTISNFSWEETSKENPNHSLKKLRKPQMLHLIPPLRNHLVLINPHVAFPRQHIHMRP